jgi:GNAT superfamily N-acetyltransferase
MKIRKATIEDCPGMLELIRELAVYEKAPEQVTVDPKHFEESGFGANPVWWAFVVEAVEEAEHTSEAGMIRGGSNSIIAFALYYIRYSTWKGQVMYLEDILVTERMRGQGIGSKLIERLKEESKEKGFKRITWQVLDWNEPAINFYKKFNATFDPEWVNVSIDL